MIRFRIRDILLMQAVSAMAFQKIMQKYTKRLVLLPATSSVVAQMITR